MTFCPSVLGRCVLNTVSVSYTERYEFRDGLNRPWLCSSRSPHSFKCAQWSPKYGRGSSTSRGSHVVGEGRVEENNLSPCLSVDLTSRAIRFITWACLCHRRAETVASTEESKGRLRLWGLSGITMLERGQTWWCCPLPRTV